jgi:hypothetical protein
MFSSHRAMINDAKTLDGFLYLPFGDAAEGAFVLPKDRRGIVGAARCERGGIA